MSGNGRNGDGAVVVHSGGLGYSGADRYEIGSDRSINGSFGTGSSIRTGKKYDDAVALWGFMETY